VAVIVIKNGQWSTNLLTKLHSLTEHSLTELEETGIGGNGWTHLIHHAMKCLGQDVTLGQITLYAGSGSKFRIGELGSIPIGKRGTIAPTRLDSQCTSSGELVMGDWF
jgi:hypothetical protein